PLGTLRGYTSLLREGMLEGRAAEKARAYEVLDDKARHLTWLVNQMLETARLEEGRLELTLEQVDLRSMVGQALEEIRLLAPASHELVLDTPTEPVLVTVDRLRVVAVVHNLLDNAVKFSPAGGTVRCRVTVEGETAVVEVQDHGLGIAAADMPTLFTRFGRIVTPENSHISGAGLGLYFCQVVAQMHGGEITAGSEPGDGSTFRLALPWRAGD
ncbi:MAG: HAMP domain-containing histidine kinase, partial [Acidimicrobiaceae bacterium]|nr:HAMP domain-containing histidine kinase [Acidimicrobiaceae bacterium]